MVDNVELSDEEGNNINIIQNLHKYNVATINVLSLSLYASLLVDSIHGTCDFCETSRSTVTRRYSSTDDKANPTYLF